MIKFKGPLSFCKYCNTHQSITNVCLYFVRYLHIRLVYRAEELRPIRVCYTSQSWLDKCTAIFSKAFGDKAVSAYYGLQIQAFNQFKRLLLGNLQKSPIASSCSKNSQDSFLWRSYSPSFHTEGSCKTTKVQQKPTMACACSSPCLSLVWPIFSTLLQSLEDSILSHKVMHSWRSTFFASRSGIS